MIANRLDLDVCKISNGTIETLYQLIPDLEKAHLLALKEMPNVEEEEQIVIVPRWSFMVTKEIKEKQRKLAELYGV